MSIRRNFRNTKPVFQVAQTAYETKLDTSKINRIVRRISTRSGKPGQSEIEFEREEGSLPTIRNIFETVPRNSWEDDDHYEQKWNDHMVDQYSQSIYEQIQRLEEDQRPIDILVLVPDTKRSERTWAYAALKKVGHRFIDYTVETTRRTIAQPDMIRLCTFHSSRGLEGQRVLVFGMERLQELADAVNADKSNLAYIVLSRSIFECVICTRRSVSTNIIPFIEQNLSEMKKS